MFVPNHAMSTKNPLELHSSEVGFLYYNNPLLMNNWLEINLVYPTTVVTEGVNRKRDDAAGRCKTLTFIMIDGREKEKGRENHAGCRQYLFPSRSALIWISPCKMLRNFLKVSADPVPSNSSLFVNSLSVFCSFSYAAESSACEVSRLWYLFVSSESWTSRSRACFSFRSRKARWAARF